MFNNMAVSVIVSAVLGQKDVAVHAAGLIRIPYVNMYSGKPVYNDHLYNKIYYLWLFSKVF